MQGLICTEVTPQENGDLQNWALEKAQHHSEKNFKEEQGNFLKLGVKN